MARAFYRNYPYDADRLSQRVRRLHIVREDGKRPGRQGYCGIHFGDVQNSAAGLFDPMPVVVPAGLRWCAKCVGEHAERLGQLNEVAAMLAAGGHGPEVA